MQEAPHAFPSLAVPSSRQKNSYISYALTQTKSALYGALAFSALIAPEFDMGQQSEAKAAYSSPSEQPKEEKSGLKTFYESKEYAESLAIIRSNVPSLGSSTYAERQKADSNIMQELTSLLRIANPLPDEIAKMLSTIDINGNRNRELTSEQASRMRELAEILKQLQLSKPARIAPVEASAEKVLSDLEAQTGFVIDMDESTREALKKINMAVASGKNDWYQVLQRVCAQTGMTIEFGNDTTSLRLRPKTSAPGRMLLMQDNVLGKIDWDKTGARKLELRHVPRLGTLIMFDSMKGHDGNKISEASFSPRESRNTWTFETGRLPHSFETIPAAEIPPATTTMSLDITTAHQPKQASLKLNNRNKVTLGTQQISGVTTELDDGTYETVLTNLICGNADWCNTPGTLEAQIHGMIDTNRYSFHNNNGAEIQPLGNPHINVHRHTITIKFQCKEPPTTVDIKAYTELQTVPLSLDLHGIEALQKPEIAKKSPATTEKKPWTHPFFKMSPF